jgi:hypothetical protein
MFTSHGWTIPNTAPAGYNPEKFEQCGGIGTCEQCSREAENLTNENAAAVSAAYFDHHEPEKPVIDKTPTPEYEPIPIPKTSTDD